MKATDRLKRAFNNPQLFFRELNRRYHRNGGLRSENTAGIDVFDEDWDTLVVLDACRYDMFESINQIDGKLFSKDSKGSSTAEWLQANFNGKKLRDTVYVTANPQLERHKGNWEISLHNITNVWLDEGWDDDTGTVLAETMTEAAIKAHERYPDKRIVVHYMQPHYPFVPSNTDFDKHHLSGINSGDSSGDGENVWGKKFSGELSVTDDKLWSMYTKNLEYVLEHVEQLVEATVGKKVITSDHGNYVGERAFPIPIREYGHPRGLYDDPVVQIPWLECSNRERRTIVTGPADEDQNYVESGVVADRLRNLGYTE